SGATLTLTAADGTTLDEVSYTDAWYLDTEKDDGGWSLELINPDDPCSDATNWKASEDERGGTAGEVNSVLDLTPDTTGPQLLYVVNEPQESITLVFNEPVDPSSLPGISFTVNGENIPNANAQFYDASGQWIILYYGEMEAGVVYSFEVLGIEDCWGNSAGLLTGTFMLGVDPEDGDIVINEILFNPVEGGYDYVEIYNRSPRAISLAGWMIANAENGVADQSDIITDNELVLLPGSYLLLTEDATILPTVYPFTRTDRIWIIESLPTYNVASGEAMLIRPDLSPSDHMSYRDDMHFDLLNSTDGVSLERIDPFRSSEDETNWHSAAESQGFGTPGYLNSQTWFGDFDPEGLSLDPEIFSPDNDGYQDVLNIHYADDTPGMVADVVIFDSEGREVRHLTQNQLLGANTTISWDGTTDENLLAPVGVYILYFEVFSTDGRVVKYKKSCVLAHQLGN
ncbi:MAG: lamin tail domain-containing protein, partial [Flavobacteriales bacterium]|nr:lamin tail domain-containing protein [Flavobacteriales bacterium]